MQRKTIKKKLILKRDIKILLSKTLISIIIFLLSSILIKKYPEYKLTIKTKVYEESFKFTKLINIPLQIFPA